MPRYGIWPDAHDDAHGGTFGLADVGTILPRDAAAMRSVTNHDGTGKPWSLRVVRQDGVDCALGADCSTGGCAGPPYLTAATQVESGAIPAWADFDVTNMLPEAVALRSKTNETHPRTLLDGSRLAEPYLLCLTA